MYVPNKYLVVVLEKNIFWPVVSMFKRKEALIEPHDENSPPLLPTPLRVLFLLEMRAVMTGESEVPERT